MSANRFTPFGQNTAEVDTYTPANVAIGNTFSLLTGSGRVLTFVATANTVANVTAGLRALVLASAIPEFLETTPADLTTAFTLTSNVAGRPFTITSSATGGTATLVRSATVANSSSQDWSNAANWSTAVVPVSTDTVTIENTSASILYGLAQSAVTLTSLTIPGTFTGTIGLPELNPNGYQEYRPPFLAIAATTTNIGTAGGVAAGSGRINLDNGSVAATVNVYSTGSPIDPGRSAFSWKGTNAANVVNAYRGSVGLAERATDACTIATLRIGQDGGQTSDATVYAGPGASITTVNQYSGTFNCFAAGSTITTVNLTGGLLLVGTGVTITTLLLTAGTVTCFAAAAITTAKIYGGTFTTQPGAGAITTLAVVGGTVSLFGGAITTLTIEPPTGKKVAVAYKGSGTIGTLTITNGGKFDRSAVQSALTITNTIQLYFGAIFNDPWNTVNGGSPVFHCNGCTPNDVQVIMGIGATPSFV